LALTAEMLAVSAPIPFHPAPPALSFASPIRFSSIVFPRPIRIFLLVGIGSEIARTSRRLVPTTYFAVFTFSLPKKYDFIGFFTLFCLLFINFLFGCL